MTYDEIKACDPEGVCNAQARQARLPLPARGSPTSTSCNGTRPLRLRAHRVGVSGGSFTEKRFRLKPDASGARRCGLVKEGRDASG